MKKKVATTKKSVRKTAKKSARKAVTKTTRKVARKSVKHPTIRFTRPPLRKKKMTIREYAEKRNIDLTRYFVGENLNMSMQAYFKKVGLPNGARLFRMVYNEKA